ncbi:MAG TPA: type II secretion system F family protein [Arthrobacter sp.]|nr:type II secretion system F family protein [Arthrobacter sp.]
MTASLLPAAVLLACLAAAAVLGFRDPGHVGKRLKGLALRAGTGPRPAAAPGRPPGEWPGFESNPASRAGPFGTRKYSGSSSANPDGLRDTAMMLELIAAMLDAGSGIGRSLELVAAAASPGYRTNLRPVVSALAIGADWETAWRSSEIRLPEILEMRDALGFAALTGAPSSAILYAQAARIRRQRFRAAEKRAASLGVKLVIPLGLCSLPAFICLGVVPVLLALVPS